MKRIKWTAKIDPRKIATLYKKYMDGQAEMADVDDVGIWLFLRVRDILLIADKKCLCPECGAEISVGEETTDCPDPRCGFSVTREQFHASWRHRELWCGNALPAFVHYFERYPLAREIGEKMILIDTLIHSFHLDLKLNLPNRIAANNLIEGSIEQVVGILDALSGVQPENDLLFRDTVQIMWKRRRGTAGAAPDDPNR